MALLKAFVFQVFLLGMYKLLFEQVVEDYLVKDELTRNCVVGFVCLLCFGIQLYTDKTVDDITEAVEDKNTKFHSREGNSAEKSETKNISKAYETITVMGPSSISYQGMVIKTQTTPYERTENKILPRDQIVQPEITNAIPSTEIKNVSKISHSGIFAEFPNASETIPNATQLDEMKNPEATFNLNRTIEHQLPSLSVINTSLEANVCEESDEDSIEIDIFVSRKSVKDPETLIAIKSDASDLDLVSPTATISECLISNEENISSTKNLSTKITIVKTEELEAKVINGPIVESSNKIENISSNIIEETVTETETHDPGYVPDTTAVSDCLMYNDQDISFTQSSEKTDEFEKKIIDTAEEYSNNVDNISLNIIKEIESKMVTEDPVVDKKDSVSQPKEFITNFTELKPSSKEAIKESSTSDIGVNVINCDNKNGTEISIVEKATVSPTRQKVKTTEDVYVAPLTIDISFIYACH